MSRVGKVPIAIPDGVKLNISGKDVSIELSGNKLNHIIPAGITALVEENNLIVTREDDSVRSRSLHGLTRTILCNMIIGLKDGFKKRLEMRGRGKKAKVQGKNLVLELGFSHPADYKIPEGVEIKIEGNIIEITGIDKQKVGEVAAEIRELQPPEPYKGSGIRYEGELVRKKAGKSAVGGGFTGSGK
ncbi:50S ribosomal protein L6 [Elusimicrobiota bacterium]